MNVQKAALIIGIVSSLAPLVAVYLRGRSRLLLISAMLTAVSLTAYFLVVMRVTQLVDNPAALVWVKGLVVCAMPILLSGFLVSASIGRDRPEESFPRYRRTFVLMGLLGLAFLTLIRHPSFVSDYTWQAGMGTIFLGWIGKAYLSYLLIGIVLIGYNLETTYRVSPSNMRPRLRLPFLAFFGLLGFFTFVLTTGMLYSTIGMGKLAASGMPIALANGLISYGFLRGSISDVAAPVSRKIVYSSFTAMAAGLYVVAVGVVAEVATFTKWSPDEVVTLSLGFLSILIAVLLLFSNRFQRRVRRFIDRNFYVNRYDYRTQWSYVTQSLNDAHRKSEVLEQAARILEEVFLTDALTISLKEPATREIRPVLGKGSEGGDARLLEDTPLYNLLLSEKRSLILDHRPDDFEYIPIYAENRGWLADTACEIVAPLIDGDEVVGVIGLERKHKDDPFTHEDATLLDSISTHIGAAYRSARLGEELASSREMELLSNWSNMIVHDVKNHLAPMRMIAENLLTYPDRPGIHTIAAKDLNRVADKMESLVHTLSELRGRPKLATDEVDLDGLIRETLSEMRLDQYERIAVTLDLAQPEPVVRGDQAMLRRVLENLVTNAIEAMPKEGSLTVRTEVGGDSEEDRETYVVLSVKDTGCGISEEFIRDGLFRPFATTKRQGTGLGLYQCRAIVRGHGGEILFDSKPGRGTTAKVILKGIPGREAERAPEVGVTVGSEAFS